MFQISRQISHLVLQRLQHLYPLLLGLPQLRQLGRRGRVLLRRRRCGRRVGPRQLIPQLRDLLVEARQVRPVVQDLEGNSNENIHRGRSTDHATAVRRI